MYHYQRTWYFQSFTTIHKMICLFWFFPALMVFALQDLRQDWMKVWRTKAKASFLIQTLKYKPYCVGEQVSTKAQRSLSLLPEIPIFVQKLWSLFSFKIGLEKCDSISKGELRCGQKPKKSGNLILKRNFWIFTKWKLLSFPEMKAYTPQGRNWRVGRVGNCPLFGRIEGTAGQWRCAALLLAHPDFGSYLHPWIYEYEPRCKVCPT